MVAPQGLEQMLTDMNGSQGDLVPFLRTWGSWRALRDSLVFRAKGQSGSVVEQVEKRTCHSAHHPVPRKTMCINFLLLL